MIKIKDKRGGHVGMILSFVIFVTFIIFLYSITQPATQIERGKQDLLSYLKIELVKEFSTDMTSAGFSLKSNLAECIKFANVDDIIPGVGGLDFVAQSEDGIVLESAFNEFKIDIHIEKDQSDFIKIYFSEEFEESTTDPCGGSLLVDPDDYTLGLVRTEEYIFESKIKALVNDFKANYTEIKDKLNIAPGDEFGFTFRNVSDDTIGTEEKNVSVNVYVEELPIQYIDSEANIKSGFLNIRVW